MTKEKDDLQHLILFLPDPPLMLQIELTVENEIDNHFVNYPVQNRTGNY